METLILGIILLVYCLFIGGEVNFFAMPVAIFGILILSILVYVAWYFVSFEFELYVFQYKDAVITILWVVGVLYATLMTYYRISIAIGRGVSKNLKDYLREDNKLPQKE